LKTIAEGRRDQYHDDQGSQHRYSIFAQAAHFLRDI
jgi:hypothetical protein